MKILLTGADGFLGSNITRELLKQGYEVRAFRTAHRQIHTLDGLPIEFFEGNLLNAKQVDEAIQGCDAVIHAAANTSVWPSRNPDSVEMNVGATQLIVAAVLKHKIKRLVYIGTANSFGFGSKALPGNEQKAYTCGRYNLDYMDSKQEAQEIVLKAVKDQGLPAVVVNPCFMFGAYDSSPGPGAMIVAICKNKIPGFTSGGRNYAYVKDVAEGVVNALKLGRIGECYILGNKNLSYHEVFDLIANETNSKHVTKLIPAVFAKLFGACNSAISSLDGKKPVVSYPLARVACDEHYYSSAKAINELHLKQTDIGVAIKESYNWLKENGKLD
jgi:dihydroflavonol-4-reductase